MLRSTSFVIPRNGLRPWILGALALAALAGAAKYQSDREEEAELAALRAVSVLPAGSEEAWNAWVDHEITTKVVRYGRTFKVAGYLPSAPMYVSINMPYTVECAYGIDIDFGDSANSGTIVDIDSPWHRVDPAPVEVPTSEGLDLSGLIPYVPSRPAGLSVVPNSIAANGLRQRLCARVAAALSILTRER